MSRSADQCLYVLAMQVRLLPEADLQAAYAKAGEEGTSLKTVLAETCEPARLGRLLRERARLARGCPCGHTTYVLPGEPYVCEHCGEPVSETASPPPEPDEVAEARRTERRKAGAGLGHEPGEAAAPRPPGRPEAPPAPPAPAGPKPKSPAQEALEQVGAQALEWVKGMQEQPGRIVAVAAFLFVTLVFWGLWSMTRGLPWILYDTKSELLAREQRKLRIAIITDPTDKMCSRFNNNVLTHRKVLALSDDFIWQMDPAQRGERGNADRSNDYAGIPHRSPAMPHLFIYTPDRVVTGGLIGCGDMTLDEFLKLLEDCKKDPRPIAQKNGG